jgi:GH25 family lysozyme M1 (1,4-beta-N-acetylmuramidase)
MIDVSQFNGQIRWGNVPRATRTLIRVTFGEGGVDTLGARNLSGARGAGLPTGGYHFLEDGTGALEIANFLHHFDPRPGGLRGMIDVEPSAYSHPTAGRVLAAITAYRGMAGHDPIVYGTHDVLAALALPESIRSCPLMLAGYGPNDGLEHPPGPAPAPWTSIAAHQYTSVGSVPGVPSHVDMSRIYDQAALLVPKPRTLLDRWRVAYIDKDHRQSSALTRTPGLWVCRHPRAKGRGPITITPHRR